MTYEAAIVATLILAGLSAFQIALIAGAPIGRFAWGGSHNILPALLRVGSVISIILYGLFATLILEKADVINLMQNSQAIDVAMWVSTGYFFVGILANAASRSKPERALMTPLASALAVLFLAVSLS